MLVQRVYFLYIQYEKKRKIGVVIHKDSIVKRNELPDGCEIVSNSLTLDRLIEFIGSSEAVYSQSYHANYWAELFGIPHYRLNPNATDSRFVNAEFKCDGSNIDGFYEKCKLVNLSFFNQVKAILQKVSGIS